MVRKLSLIIISVFLVSCSLVPSQAGLSNLKDSSNIEPLADSSMLKITSTWTVTPSLPPAATPEFTATATQPGTITPIVTNNPSPTAQPTYDYDYIIQAGTPLGMENFLHADRNCAWMGIAGQVFSQNGSPVNNLIVQVQGTLEGNDLLLLALTGSAAAVGPGGYEIALADHVSASSGQLRVQLFDLSGNPLSEQTLIDTFGSCDKSLIIANFSKISGESSEILNYIPFIRK